MSLRVFPHLISSQVNPRKLYSGFEKVGHVYGLKGQTSLEYLTNYGWMLLAVALVGVTLFSQMGGRQCELGTQGFSAPFPTVTDLYQYENETLGMQVRNPSEEQINLREVVIREENQIVGVVEVDQMINGEASSNVFTNRFSTSEDCVTRDLQLKYGSSTLENLTSSGQLVGKLSLVPLKALFGVEPAFADTGEQITFNASDTVGKNEVSSYSWDMGDGTTDSGEVVTHSYGSDGVYSVELTVEDKEGITTRRTKQVFIGGLLLKRGGVFPQINVTETVATDCLGDQCSEIDGEDTSSVNSGGATLEGSLITRELLISDGSLCLTSRISEDTDAGCPTTEDGEGSSVTLENNVIDWIIAPTIKPESGSLCLGNDCQTN
jgi:PKD repeat protein